VLASVAALAFVGAGVWGAITVVYNSASTATVKVQAPPVVWSAGPDASDSLFVHSFTLSANRTQFAVTINPVPEANVTWGNFTTLTNQAAAPVGVVVTGSSAAAHEKVLEFRLAFYQYGTNALLGTLNVRDANPTLDLGTLAPGAKVYVKVIVKLDTAAGLNNLPSSIAVGLTVTP
jgi:hypothetical protein